jgi:fimbrial chaperone protein
MRYLITRFAHWASTAMLGMLLFTPAHAGTSILIWPLDPVIETEQRTGSVWLQNVGTEPVTLQIRVLAWDQRDNQDDYQTQSVLISTPPFTTLPVGKKQLIRLTLTQPAPAGQELAYRILIDEIPAPRSNEEPGGQSSSPSNAGLTFQMRYSLPLFVYGDGLWQKQAPSRRDTPAKKAEPKLSWRIDEADGQRYLYVHNTGVGHARLSQVRLTSSSNSKATAGTPDIASGLLGYVLPGKTMRWLLAPSTQHGDTLQAQLSSNAAPVTMSPE